MSGSENSERFEEALNCFPGGVSAAPRSFKYVGKTPFYVKSAEGAYLQDIENRLYLDYFNSCGSEILGHSHPEVLETLKIQLEKGFSPGMSAEPEVELAKLICSNIPDIEKIRFVSSETEACSNAIQLARAYTGKSKIIVFKGSRHENLPIFVPGNSVNGKEVLIAQYNDAEQAEDFFRHYGNEIAAVMVEPVAANSGCILPENGFLKNLRTICKNHNALLIFDETRTGFRLNFGGAQETFGVKADLVCYGALAGGGISFGTLGGRNEIMKLLAPKGDADFRESFSGNPLAVCAGLATLNIIKNDPFFYEKINKTAEILDFEIGKILNSKNIVHRINRKGSLMSVFFHISSVSNDEEARKSNFALFNYFFQHLLENGIFLPPNAFQSWYISSAIGENEIDKTLEAVKKFQYS